MTDLQDPAGLCDACGAPLVAHFPRVADPQTGEMFRIDRCSACGLGHTLPQPAELGRYYGGAYHGGRHGITERLCMARRLGFAAAIAEPGRILDFGCGDGGFLESAVAAGWEGVGVEMKPEHARARGVTVVESLDGAGDGFDVISLWHSLEHLRSPRATLEALAPRLAQGGHLIVAVPNWASLQSAVFGAGWFHVDVPRHLFHFPPKALEGLLATTGFSVVKRWNLEVEIDLFGWTQSTLNRLLPRPNVLFDVVTGRERHHGTSEILGSVALGSVITVLAAPVVPVAAALGRGAITIVAAQRS